MRSTELELAGDAVVQYGPYLDCIWLEFPDRDARVPLTKVDIEALVRLLNKAAEW